MRKLLLALAMLAASSCSSEEPEQKDLPPVEKEPQILEGDATVTSSEDLARLAKYDSITGKLVVKRSTLERLDLPNLKSIGGRLYIQKNTALKSVNLGSLLQVGTKEGDELVIERNIALENIDLGRLSFVTHSFSLRNNNALKSINLDSLMRVLGHGLQISENPSLVRLELKSVLDITYLTVSDCVRLEAISMPGLRSVLHIAIQNNPRLLKLNMTNLFGIYVDPTINADRAGLQVVGNDSLQTLKGFENLQVIGRNRPLEITGNQNLSTCAAILMRDRLAKNGWRGSGDVCGNRVDACHAGECTVSE